MGYFIILQDKYYKIQLISENEKRIVPDIEINEVKLIDHGEENDAVKACNSFLYFQRYVIQVITDNRVDQVKKTYRQFQYFNKILHKKMGLKDNLLALSKHIKSTNNFRELQLYIQRLNSGYLLYRATQQIQARRNANIDFFSKKTTNDVFQLQPIKTRQLRNYLYDLLYRQDQLFVDGLQSDSGSDISPPKQIVPNGSSIKTEFVKQTIIQNPKQKEKSRNPLKNLFHGSPFDKALQKAANTTVGGGVANQIQRQQVNLSQAINMTKSGVERKSNTPSKFKKAFLNLAYKAKMTGQKGQNLMTNNHEQTNLRGILRNITKCWIKFPNSYNNRDRNVIYKPYIWQQYDFKISDNIIEFTNNSSVHRHRKIFVIFQCDVELNFQEYTKLIIKNKIDKNPLEIRLSLDDNLSTVTQQYLSLYTYIKQTVKQQEEKLKMVSPNEKNSKVCNKVRIRIGLKRKTQKANSSNSNGSQSPVISGQQFNMSRRNASQLFLNFPHGQKSNDQKQQFQFKQIRQPPANLSKVQVKIIQSTINVVVTISLDSYVDIDLPILDNFGALDIIVSEVPKQTGFLPGKQVLCTFHMPVQTVYDYMYGYQIPKKRKNQLKTKMMQIQHTKVNLTFDYTCIGNYYALCSYNQNDIFEDDQPPQQFNKDQFRMNNNRLKRIVWSIQLYLERFKDLRNFTYPNLSYLFYIYIAVSCLFYDNNNFLLWIFLLLLAVLFYNSPAYNLYLSSLVDILKMKAKKKRLDTVLFKKNKLIQDEYVIPMKKVAKIQFLQQFILTRKVKRSIYKKYKRLLQVLLQAQILLTKIVSFVQKIKNIFIWYHYKKTKLLFTFIAIMAFSLLVLPIRFILFLVVLKTMSKGAKYHSRIQDLNKVIIIELLRIIIRQNNFNLMSLYFKQIYRPFEFHNPETFSFFKTCKTSLSDWLQVNIQMDAIIRKSTNMSEFITNLTKCKIKYKIRKEICQQYGFSLQWAKNQSSATKTFDLIYGFIVTIPSDKYIMGVKTVSGNDEQQSEQVDNIIDRQLLNF